MPNATPCPQPQRFSVAVRHPSPLSSCTMTDDGTSASGGGATGGGLGNLLALAHLAEQRREAPAAPSPANKRAVPAALGASNDAPPPKRPRGSHGGPRRLTIETSRPTQRGALASASRPHGGRRAYKRGSAFKMKANQPSFPVVLLAILSAERNREAIAFLSDDRSFIVVNPATLARHVLPVHFEDRVPTIEEFAHLLAIWGFESTKDPKYPEVNVYSHPQFRKGDWESCLAMKVPDPTARPDSPEGDAVVGEANPLDPPRSVTPPAAKLASVRKGAVHQRPKLVGYRRATIDALPRGLLSAGMALPFSNGRGGAGLSGGLGGIHSRGPVPRRLADASAPSDAQVRAATATVVSAALDALRPPSLGRQVSVPRPSRPMANFARSRRHTVDALPSQFALNGSISANSATVRLDAMTNLFLERSRARLNATAVVPRSNVSLQRPASTAREALEAEVEAQASALVAAQMQRRTSRKVSLLGHLGGGV